LELELELELAGFAKALKSVYDGGGWLLPPAIDLGVLAAGVNAE